MHPYLRPPSHASSSKSSFIHASKTYNSWCNEYRIYHTETWKKKKYNNVDIWNKSLHDHRMARSYAFTKSSTMSPNVHMRRHCSRPHVHRGACHVQDRLAFSIWIITFSILIHVYTWFVDHTANSSSFWLGFWLPTAWNSTSSPSGCISLYKMRPHVHENTLWFFPSNKKWYNHDLLMFGPLWSSSGPHHVIEIPMQPSSRSLDTRRIDRLQCPDIPDMVDTLLGCRTVNLLLSWIQCRGSTRILSPLSLDSLDRAQDACAAPLEDGVLMKRNVR